MRSIFFIVLFIQSLFSQELTEITQSDKNELNSYANTLQGNFGNSTTITNNYAQPLTSDTELSTLDNSTTGSGTITCEDNQEEIEVLSIGYSRNSNLIVNYSYLARDNVRATGSISNVDAVCTNGFLQCNSDYTSCQGINITDYDFSYSTIEPEDMIGCVCINNDCGEIAKNAKEKVLNDIGIIVTPFLSQNTSSIFTITKNTNDGNTINFYGQNYSNCYEENNLADGVNSNNIDTKTINAVNEATLDESTAYSVFNQSTNNTYEDTDNTIKNVQSNASSIMSTTSVTENSDNFDISYIDKTTGSEVVMDATVLKNDTVNEGYCEVTWLEISSSVFSDSTNRSTENITNTEQKIEIRTCNELNECPIDTTKGETIKQNCGQVNNLNEAVGVIAAINAASQDITCTTNSN